jgi:hypothetical protein
MKNILIILFLHSPTLLLGQIQYFHESGSYPDLEDLQFNTPIHTLHIKDVFPADSIDLLELKQHGIEGYIKSYSDFYELGKNNQALIYHKLNEKNLVWYSDTNTYKGDLLVHQKNSHRIIHHPKDSIRFSYQTITSVIEYDANGKRRSLEERINQSETRKLTLYCYKDTLLTKVLKKRIHPDYKNWRWSVDEPGNYFENPKDFYRLKKLGHVKYNFRFKKNECIQHVHILEEQKVSHRKSHYVTGSFMKSRGIKLNYQLVNGKWKLSSGSYLSPGHSTKVHWTYNGNQTTISSGSGNRKSSSIINHDDLENIISMEYNTYEGKKLLETTKYEYQYKYDSYNNWIKKSTYENGILIKVVERMITYYE